MSSMGDAYGMDGDWGFPGMDSASMPGLIPLQSPPQSLIPPPPQDQSAALVPLLVYAPAPVLEDPNATMPPDSGTPSAEGIAKAFSFAEHAQDLSSEAAAQIAKLTAGDPNAALGLAGATRYLTGPLAIGGVAADTVADLNHGASPLDALVGNAIRAGLVYGGGAVVGAETGGVPGVAAGMALDHYLPSGAAIGHAILNPPVPSDPAAYAMYKMNM